MKKFIFLIMVISTLIIISQNTNVQAVDVTFETNGGSSIDSYELNNLSIGFTEQTPLTTTELWVAGVHAADLDNDGDLDVLSASYQSHRIMWYKNNGDGTFTEQAPISTTTEGAYQVHAADLNNDGYLDVISASAHMMDSVIWYKNNGDGTFAEQPAISSIGVSSSLYVGDLNNDGYLDIVSNFAIADRVTWYKNNGDETFTEQPDITATADAPTVVHGGDFNHDGYLDIVVASVIDNRVTWYKNNGDETFTEQPAISTTINEVYGLYASDLNNDGNLDLLVTSRLGEVAWYKNNGDETFTKQTPLTTTADYAETVYAADINYDGHIDVFVAADNGLFWYKNNGDETFTEQPVITTKTIGVYVADLDNDGNLDVLSSKPEVGTVVWYKNNSEYQLQVPDEPTKEGYTFAGWYTDPELTQLFDFSLSINSNLTLYAKWNINQYTVTFEDFDGMVLDTQIIDHGSAAIAPTDPSREFYTFTSWNQSFDNITSDTIITAEYELITHTISFETNGGSLVESYYFTILNTNFAKQPYIPISINDVSYIDTADLNGDDLVDIVATSEYDDTITWSKNNGDGTFTEQVPISTTADSVFGIHIADLDSDGNPDVISISPSVYTDYTLTWYKNNGDGTFTEQEPLSTTSNGLFVYAADLDNDGNLDVISPSLREQSINWYKNNGDGTFTEQAPISTTANEAATVYAADLDNDGYLDVISILYADNIIAWYKNNGDGTFTEQAPLSTSSWGYSVYAADLDNDGNLDVIAPSLNDQSVDWYKNNGDGTFTKQTPLSNAVEAFTIKASDLNNDGNLDVIITSLDGKVHYFINNGDGTFTENIISLNSGGWLSVDDLDNDGNLDIIIGNYDGSKFEWFKNIPEYQLQEPNEPTKEGYTFAGWYTNPELTLQYDFNLSIDSDLNLYAKWNINQYTVTFKDVDGTILDTQTINHGSAATAPNDPSRVGYTFIGWDQVFDSITSDTVITAQYELNTYTVTFEDFDGTILDTQTIDHGSAAIAPTDPSREFYTFIGWDQAFDNITSDTIITAQYEFITHTISFETNGGSLVESYYFKILNTNFAKQSYIPISTVSVTLLDTGDLDGDGFVDIITTDRYSDTITWYQNNGDGTFTEQMPISTTAKGAFGIHIADLDNDGDLDIVSASQIDDTIEWYQNNGDGTFTEQTPLSTTATGATGVHIADLNNDGYLDVISASYQDAVAWYKNNGDGTFTEQTPLSTTVDAFIVYAADLNNDGYLDVISTSNDQTTIVWYKNNTDGTFTEQSPLSTTAAGVFGIHVVDIDNDGHLDVISALMNDNTVAWYKNNGDGTFTEQTPLSTTVLGASNVYAIDINDDDYMDIIAIGLFGNVHYFINNGDGTFNENEMPADTPLGISVNDLDNDGNLDIITGSFRYEGGSFNEEPKIEWFKNIPEYQLQEPNEPTKEGYTFAGWYTDPELTQQYDFSLSIDGDLTLYAKWNINQYTVTFKDVDGTILDTQTINHGSAAIAPIDLSRVGYTFTGWDQAFDTITSDMVITAQYEINTYTVTFEDFDGSILETQTIDYGSGATPSNDPSRVGYTFIGWDKTFDTITEDIVITAQYEINTYTVTFKDHDGTIIETQAIEHGSSAIPIEPTRKGYAFIGWDQPFFNITSDITITAEYVINTYMVTFKDHDGTILETQTIDYESGATVPNDPSRIGYTFTGWDKSFDTITEDIVVTAQYEINTYTVTFKDFDGTILETQTIDYGNAATVPNDPSRVGYTFTGWDQQFDNITNDSTITAQYHINTYTINFESNGGNVVDSIMQDYNTSLSEPSEPVRDGYTFIGWYRDEDLTEKYTFDKIETITLYAKWEKDSSLTIPLVIAGVIGMSIVGTVVWIKKK